MNNEFNVKTEVFQGPLGLLLMLVEKRKLFINDISLSCVADGFLEYIRNHNNFSLGKTADFILIASTLVLIKSRSLFPDLKLTDQEEETIEELEKRLVVYRKFKDISIRINDIFGRNIIFSKRRTNKKVRPVFSPDASISKETMRAASLEVLKVLPKPDNTPSASVQAVISLDEMISNLAERVMATSGMTFRKYTNDEKQDQPTMIVSFLAILELVREGTFIVRQEKQFEDIYIESNDNELSNNLSESNIDDVSDEGVLS